MKFRSKFNHGFNLCYFESLQGKIYAVFSFEMFNIKIFKILKMFKYNMKFIKVACWINSKISNRDKNMSENDWKYQV